ncbi:hypothetical protein [Hahella ganghwensis]|uniref:hypothetical protein n=1 Tax=Hahella ganghwensis TaxID=286420 RepID=UPI00038227B1|nr:hypothetical protein [Hahella ganghwensis]
MTATTSIKTEKFAFELSQVIRDHFTAAHERVPEFYRQHFISVRGVSARHWKHKRDIPQDLMSVPRALWRLSSRLWQKSSKSPVPLSGKETALLQALETDLLQLSVLQQKLNQVTERWIPEWKACEASLSAPMTEQQSVAVMAFLQDRLGRLGGTREGSRDLLMFLLIGGLGRQFAGHLGSQITFGSAMATGAAMANGVYLSQQSFWGLLWTKFAGVPAWVGWVGAGTGMLATLAVAPLLSPLAELAINRLRGERYLHKMLDQIERENFHTRGELIDMVGPLGSLSQLAPDLLALLRQLHP